jgi:DNA-binding MarR family transcriptional regulator
MYQEAETTAHRPVRLPADFAFPLGFLLAKTHVGLRAIADAALAPYGLTIVQFSFLSILTANPGKSSAELAREFCVSPQSVAPLVGRLEADGYIERRPHPLHGRVIECWMTPKGAAILEKAKPVVVRAESEVLLDELSLEELKVLEGLLFRVLDRVRTRTGVDVSPLEVGARIAAPTLDGPEP